MNLAVTSGDITQTQSDGLITAINSGQMWYGGIDDAIQRVAGDTFHKQAATAMPLTDGQTIIAYGSTSSERRSFRDVVFVVDDLQRKLREIVYLGLKAADKAGLETITLPTIRLGVMLGVVEKSKEEAVAEMTKGVQQFIAEKPQSVKKITFVVYNDPMIAALLSFNLQYAQLM
jgi:O-acetyl-ADP-ribose deacetylase (regulator of RNase III)